mmetsp:Transcript_133575/g.285638  ORF Transcript_133575/g.285638 Transcript_133575/m.285638 type:complete len:222 (+) Transcript_133575:437-1102(+)
MASAVAMFLMVQVPLPSNPSPGGSAWNRPPSVFRNKAPEEPRASPVPPAFSMFNLRLVTVCSGALVETAQMRWPHRTNNRFVMLHSAICLGPASLLSATSPSCVPGVAWHPAIVVTMPSVGSTLLTVQPPSVEMYTTPSPSSTALIGLCNVATSLCPSRPPFSPVPATTTAKPLAKWIRTTLWFSQSHTSKESSLGDKAMPCGARNKVSVPHPRLQPSTPC